MRQKKLKRKHRTCVPYSIYTVCAFITIFLISLVVYFIDKEMQQYRAGAEATAETNSIFCDDLSMHPDDDYKTFDKSGNRWRISLDRKGNYICASRNVADIVDTVVVRQSRIRLASGLVRRPYLFCGNHSLARKSGAITAYFSRKIHRFNLTDTGSGKIVLWDQHSKHSYIDPQISYRQGELTVPEGRIYNVYASIVFSLHDSKNAFRRPPIMSLRICKKTYGYEQTLFSRAELYRNTTKGTVSSLRVAGQVSLQKGDIVLVRVSNLERLISDSAGNTFGVYPL